jgi:ADP-ribosylglycohydrolase
MKGGIVIDSGDYADRVEGCWAGKAVGGTLGAPHEGKTHVLDLDFYRPVPTENAPNDDLDLQLVWLVMLEETGFPPRLSHLADWWIRCCSSYPWNEYGFCRRNLGKGLRPPVSGCFENYYVDEMGSPIRSEIWACLAPANPQLAAAMAWKDSVLDHAGGEGMHGEMFWAAVQSAAFVESDPATLIRVGLGMIPLHSQISRAVREAVWCRENGVTWAEARERMVRGFVFGKGPQPCHATVNHGFTILGWLYGRDFGDMLAKAVNCAYDTDCTGATLGALLGILGGRSAIPSRWIEPVGERIVLHKFTKLPEAPKTIGELTKRTTALARRAAKEMETGAALGSKASLPADVRSRLMRNDLAIEARSRDVHCAVEDRGSVEITLHYGGEPVLRPGVAKTVGVSLSRGGMPVEGGVELSAPEWIAVKPAEPKFGQTRFELLAAKALGRGALKVAARAAGESVAAEFAILGPGDATGFPAVDNVPKCPRCHAWEGACVCDRKDAGRKA